ncbi:MAG: hypothetical protein ACI4CY_00605 [Candidatus Gastranaerophilaceae bacterium]
MITQVSSLANTQVKNRVLLKNTQKGSNIKTSSEVQKNPDAVMEAMNFAGAQNKVSFGALNGKNLNQAMAEPLNNYISGLKSFGIVERLNSSFAEKVKTGKLLEMDDEKLLKVIKNDESLKELFEAIGGKFLRKPQMDMVKSVNENPQNFTTPISFVDNHNKSMSTMREYLRTYVDEFQEFDPNLMKQMDEVVGKTRGFISPSLLEKSNAKVAAMPEISAKKTFSYVPVEDIKIPETFKERSSSSMADKVRDEKLLDLNDEELYNKTLNDNRLAELYKAMGGKFIQPKLVDYVNAHRQDFPYGVPFIDDMINVLSTMRDYFKTFVDKSSAENNKFPRELDEYMMGLIPNISPSSMDNYFAEVNTIRKTVEFPRRNFSYNLSTPANTEPSKNLNDYLNSAAYHEKVSAETFSARTSSPMANKVRDEKLLEMSDSRLTETVENDELLYGMYKSLGGRKLSECERRLLAFLMENASYFGSLTEENGLAYSVIQTRLANVGALNLLRDYFRSFLCNMESRQGRIFDSLDEAVRNANML